MLGHTKVSLDVDPRRLAAERIAQQQRMDEAVAEAAETAKKEPGSVPMTALKGGGIGALGGGALGSIIGALKAAPGGRLAGAAGLGVGGALGGGLLGGLAGAIGQDMENDDIALSRGFMDMAESDRNAIVEQAIQEQRMRDMVDEVVGRKLRTHGAIGRVTEDAGVDMHGMYPQR